MTTDIQKLDPDAAIDLAYDIFLEMAGENLDPADIMLFNLQFEDRGAVEFVETADDWEQEIGVLIDPDAFAEVWVGLVNEKDEMDDVDVYKRQAKWLNVQPISPFVTLRP